MVLSLLLVGFFYIRYVKNARKFWISIPFLVCTILVLIISIQKYLAPPKLFFGEFHTQYNNYEIFKYSSIHLLNNQDLYSLYPSEHGDLFKYSPTFAWLFIPFSFLPDFIGLLLWNCLNSLPLVFALYVLAYKKAQQFLPVFFIMAIELATSLHSSQSNGLVSFLLLAFYLSLMHRRFFLSGLFLALSVYIKLFGGLAILLLVLFPEKRKHLFSFAIWMLILFLVPLTSISFNHLLYHYASWIELLKNDPSHALNFSLATVIERYSPTQLTQLPLYVHLVGLGMLAMVLIKAWKSKQTEQMLYLLPAFIMMWFVMFNHKSESPTYVIAMVGVSLLWIPLGEKMLFRILMGLAILFISLGSTDLFPLSIREEFLIPSQVKAIGLIPIFFYTFFMIIQGNLTSKA